MALPTTVPESPYFDLPLTDVQSVVATSVAFTLLWYLLRQHVSKAGPVVGFRSVTHLNSLLYAIFNAGLSYLLWRSYSGPSSQTYTLNSHRLNIEAWMLGYAFHLSKFWEYVDVLSLVARGFAINKYMAFHHLTTPYLTYSRIVSMPPSSITETATGDWLAESLPASTLPSVLSPPDWRVFALANSLHQTIMYTCLSRVPGTDALRRVVPLTSWLQLALGIGTDVAWMFATNGGKALNGKPGPSDEPSPELTNRAISILVLMRYAMLYWEERSQYVLTEKGSKEGSVERERKDK